MKKVVKTIETPSLVELRSIEAGKYYLAVTPAHQCVLQPVGSMWAFRAVRNSGSWLSGSHPNMTAAIEQAISIANTEVFQFDTFLELAQYITNNHKS